MSALQLLLFTTTAPAAAPPPACDHPHGFITLSTVPAGFICSNCRAYLWQYLPEPPESLGYLSGDWSWGIKHGFRWTTIERAA